jgi:hypothetical protein
MKALIHSVKTDFSRGEWVKVNLELWLITTDTPFCDIWEHLKPGAVLTDFGVGDASTKETKVSLPRGRKLFLDKT